MPLNDPKSCKITANAKLMSPISSLKLFSAVMSYRLRIKRKK
jgi:hypothetical protein